VPRRLIFALLLLATSSALAQTLAISPERLPDAIEGRLYYQRLEARGGEPPYRWTFRGSLPAGMTLDSSGLLSGIPRQAGEFTFSVTVTDASRPARSARREFTLRVRAVLTIAWTRPPAVASGGIYGELLVTNGGANSFDLTVIVLAVAANGRATALGYQHFVMPPGQQAIPFGSTLPRGGYVVYADAITETAATGVIRRARLQSPPLNVP
jgi:hypothetical protein